MDTTTSPVLLSGKHLVTLTNDSIFFLYEKGVLHFKLQRNNHSLTLPETLCAQHQPFFCPLKETSFNNNGLKTLTACQIYVSFWDYMDIMLCSSLTRKSGISFIFPAVDWAMNVSWADYNEPWFLVPSP